MYRTNKYGTKTLPCLTPHFTTFAIGTLKFVNRLSACLVIINALVIIHRVTENQQLNNAN